MPLPKCMIGRKDKYMNADLPPGCQDNGVWHCVFIPTFLQYLGSRDSKDAWSMVDEETVPVLQKIWDYTYGAKILHKIVIHGAVFSLVSVHFSRLSTQANEHYVMIQAEQHACEWRNGFASMALAMLQAFFNDNDIQTDTTCQDFARDGLENWTFLYRDVRMGKASVS